MSDTLLIHVAGKRAPGEEHRKSLANCISKLEEVTKGSGVHCVCEDFALSRRVYFAYTMEEIGGNEFANPVITALAKCLIAGRDLVKQWKSFGAVSGSPDYTKGIFQSIGFKEFHEYLVVDEERRKSEEGQKLFERGVELLKIATRQYAKRQCKWIRNRFLKDPKRQVPPIYELDSSDLSRWKENVSKKAEEIVEAHIAGRKPSVEPSRMEGSKEIVDKTYKCEICHKILLGIRQWEVHLKSSKHARALKRKNRLEKEKGETQT